MKTFLSKASLKFRIAFIFTFTITLLLILMISVVAVGISDNFKRDLNHQYIQLVKAKSEQVNEIITKMTSVQNLIASNEILQSSDPKIIQKFIDQYHNISQFYPEISLASFIWPDGKGYTTLGTWVDVKDRPYFKAIFSDNQDFIVNAPVIGKSTGLPVVVLSKAIKKPDGTVQGLLNVTVSLAKVSEITSQIQVEKKGYGWACDGTGLLLAYPQKDQIMKLNLTDSESAGDIGLNTVAKQMLTEDSGFGSWKKSGSEMVSYYSKIPGPTGWYLGISLSIAEMEAGINLIISILFSVLIICVIITFVLSILLATSIVRPIKRAAKGFRELAEGDADLTQKIEIIHNDEIGKLTQDFNSFVAKLHEIVVSLKKSQTEISSISVSLSESSEQTLTTVLQITSNINTVSEQTKIQTQSAISSSSAVEQIAHNIESLDKVISEQVVSVTEASAAIEEMVRNMDSVFVSMEKLSNEYQDLSVQAEKGKEARAQSEKLIKEISQRSSSLQEANHAISDISSRTNLLAMNAAIEAAHAGQSGRGFAVVADEIRKLAENSSLQSKTIGKDIAEVETSISTLVNTSQTLATILSLVENKITETKLIVSEVHNAMSEQKTGSQQMLEALNTLNSLSASVKTGSEEMKNGNTTLIFETNQLRTTAQQVQESIGQISSGTQVLNTAAKNSSVMAEQTKEAVQEMEAAVGRFKV